MAASPGPRDLRETIVLALVVTVLVIVGGIAIMGIVTAGICGFEDSAVCTADTVNMTTLRATLDLVLPPLIGFVAAVVGFYFGEKSGTPPRR